MSLTGSCFSSESAPRPFPNRPFGAKRFQTIHYYSVDVARGLVLLFGISTTALPSWVSRTRWNNLKNGLVLRRYGRSKRIDELISSIVPRGTSFHRSVELEFSPIVFDPGQPSCCCDFSGPTERGAVNADAVHDHGQPTRSASVCPVRCNANPHHDPSPYDDFIQIDAPASGWAGDPLLRLRTIMAVLVSRHVTRPNSWSIASIYSFCPCQILHSAMKRFAFPSRTMMSVLPLLLKVSPVAETSIGH